MELLQSHVIARNSDRFIHFIMRISLTILDTDKMELCNQSVDSHYLLKAKVIRGLRFFFFFLSKRRFY